MKRLSRKDLIIALGVAVAAIISVSSIYLKDNATQHERSSTQPVPSGKPKPTVIIKKVWDKLASRTHF